MSHIDRATFSQRSLPKARSDWLASLQRTFPDHVPLYAVSAAFVSVAIVVSVVYRLPLPLSTALFFLVTLIEIAGLVCGVYALRLLWKMFQQGQPGRPLVAIGRALVQSLLAGDRFGNLVHGLLSFTPLMVVFAALKPDIARIQPFAWDQTFMRADLALGFGNQIWKLLQPVFGHPLITTILSVSYGAWFLVMFGCFFWQLIKSDRSLQRIQFLVAFAFSWFFAGFVLATIFSSAGPCFYSYVAAGTDPYAPLLAYLEESSKHWPIWTVQIQHGLWAAYQTGSGSVEGISAMPSMHVTIAGLLAIFGWRTNWQLGLALTSFAAIICLASILLAWHYAVDCFAGAALAFVFWRAAGFVVGMWSASLERAPIKSAVAA